MSSNYITNRYSKTIKNDVLSNNSPLSHDQEKSSISGAGVTPDLRNNRLMKCNLLEVNEVCDLLKIGRSTLYGLVNKKTIKAVKLLGRTLFRETDICDFVANLAEYEGGPNGF